MEGWETAIYLNGCFFGGKCPKHHQSLPSPARPNIAMDVIYARGSEKWTGLEDDVLSLSTGWTPGGNFSEGRALKLLRS